MELGILGSLWANCALGATFLAVPTIQNLQSLQALPTVPTVPSIPTLQTLIEAPIFQVQHLPQLQQIEPIEQVEQAEDLDEIDDSSIEATTIYQNDQETQHAESVVSESMSETMDSEQWNRTMQESDSQDESEQEQEEESDEDTNRAVNFLIMEKINILNGKCEEEDVDEKGKRKKKKKKPYQRIRYGREEYRCTICPYTCTTERAFLKHLRSHATDDKDKEPEPADTPRLSCPVCGKDRDGEVALNKHMQRHRNDKNFCCDICAFKTVQLKKLIQHRRMHTGERPHLCPHCVYRAARRDNLRSHVRRVHKRDNLTCDTFSPRGMLIKPSRNVIKEYEGEIDKDISKEETM